jgi:hypothetical protein
METVRLLYSKGNPLYLKPSTAMVFLDETGEECLRDPNYPIFGIGGCVVLASLYGSNVLRPWQSLKDAEFYGRTTPLHAADLRKPTDSQLNALNSFFASSLFGRIAVIVSDKSAFDKPYNLIEITMASLYQRIKAVLSYMPFEDIIMILEDSPKAELILTYSESHKLIKNGKSIDCVKCIMPKTTQEPGLEVADFIVHCAGTAVRDRLKGKRSPEKERSDFFHVFRSVDPRLSNFLEVLRGEEIALDFE